MTEKVKTSFVVHCDWVDSMKDLPAEQCKLLIQAMSEYTKTGSIPTLEDQTVKALFSFIYPKIKDDKEKYEATCKKRQDRAKQAAEKRWESKKQSNTNSCSNMLTNAQTYSECHDNDYDHDSDSDSDSDSVFILKKEKNKKEKTKKFIKPTLQEVQAYCQERHNNVNPEQFIAYYEANGWKVGRNPMKNWQACIRTWEGNGYNKAPPKPEPFDAGKYLLEKLQKEKERKKNGQRGNDQTSYEAEIFLPYTDGQNDKDGF